MLLIAGLGNFPAEYEHTRHNAGFMALDSIAEKLQISGFRFQAKLNAQVTESTISDRKVILAKPQTMMNNSGEAVRSLSQFYKIPPSEIVVIHDDIDIPLGEIKVSEGSGSAGHKGVESVIRELGTQEFTRIRIGILPAAGKPKNVEDFVLKKFLPEEQEKLHKAIVQTTQTLLQNP